jgi:hypothetical protein
MSLTKYKYGILATPVIGASGFGWKGNSKTFFVDGTYGSDDNDGLDPNKAIATIQKAIGLAAAHDVIYVFDKDLVDYGDSTGKYTETLTVAKAKFGLNIIGCSQMLGAPVRECGIYGVTGSPVLTNQAGSLTLENLKFGFNTGVTYAVYSVAGEDETSWGHNPVFYNCRFGGFTSNSAIRGIGLQGMQVRNCLFVDNLCSIWFNSSAGTASDLLIDGNYFATNGITAISEDIFVNTQGAGYVVITRNVFAHTIPTVGRGRYIVVADTLNGNVSFNSFSTGYNSNLTIGTAGTGCKIPNSLNSGPNWGNSALMAASA